ncbi:21722_t:CDS:1, partial [Racocetra persica]
MQLLSTLQDFPYLKSEFNFSKNPLFTKTLVEIKNLEDEVQMEREEAEKALQKAQE